MLFSKNQAVKRGDVLKQKESVDAAGGSHEELCRLDTFLPCV